MAFTRTQPFSAFLLSRVAGKQHILDTSKSTSQRAVKPLINCYVKRFLNLQEYQSKELFRNYGATVQRFVVASNKQEAEQAVGSLQVPEYVVKAQILAGGRGKGHFVRSGLKGGVKLTKEPKEAVKFVQQMVGDRLITKQTPKDGVEVRKVMIAESFDIARETYLAILMDPRSVGPMIVASPEGGVDIEEVAEKRPDAVLKLPIDIKRGLVEEDVKQVVEFLKFKGSAKIKQATQQIYALYELFLAVDATQVEVNPFGETPDGRVVCFDAKINFDDNASFRQEAIFAMEDKSEIDWRELEAQKSNLNYIQLEGNIACLANGAGLAMATMDQIMLEGGRPANFLDVGGRITVEGVTQAFRLLTADENVKAILVNIFGGIVNCATVAKGIAEAARTINLKVPLVVRLKGTNADEADRILSESNLKITLADDMGEAARLVVQAIDNHR